MFLLAKFLSLCREKKMTLCSKCMAIAKCHAFTTQSHLFRFISKNFLLIETESFIWFCEYHFNFRSILKSVIYGGQKGVKGARKALNDGNWLNF